LGNPLTLRPNKNGRAFNAWKIRPISDPFILSNTIFFGMLLFLNLAPMQGIRDAAAKNVEASIGRIQLPCIDKLL